MLTKITATNNLHILLLLVSNVLQINDILQHVISVHRHILSTFRNMSCGEPFFVNQYYALLPYVYYSNYYRLKL